ncbi:MAG TPA: hypothetical protein VFW12_05060, partial [Candidatus Limnocylindria bacterium]|nr:hypothetical protein [Candidatus Limnocylindria bacterium]
MTSRARALWRDERVRGLVVLFGAALALRLLLIGARGFTVDYEELMSWGRGMAAFGPFDFYERFGSGRFGFPPNYPALLYPLWVIAELLQGDAYRNAVKGLSIPFDLGIGAALYAMVRPHAGHPRALAAAALYLFAPPVLIAGPYWGQVDAAGTLPFLLALWAAASRRWALAGALAMAAALVKPQFAVAGWVVLVAAVFVAVRDRDLRPPAWLAAGALAMLLVVAVPLRLTPGAFIQLLRDQSALFEFSSVYALNPWGVIFGFLVPDTGQAPIGLALLAIGLVAAVVPLRRRQDLAALLAAGVFVAIASYFLPTRVHERYLFPAIALIAPFAATRIRLRWPFAVVTGAFTVGLLYVLWRATSVAGLTVPAVVRDTLFTTPGMNAVALALMAASAVAVWRLARGDASLEPDGPPPAWPAAGVPGRARLRAFALPAPPPEQRPQRIAVAILLAVPTLLNLIGLWPELVSSVPKVNDETLHFVFTQRAADAFASGQNVIDFWMAELELGFPEFFYYQHLPHLFVAALQAILFDLPDPYLLFNAVRYALLIAFPFTVYWSLRTMGFPRVGSAAAAAASSLIHSQPAFGLEYGSYIWRGYGLFTQLWAAHLFFIGLALFERLMRTGRGHPAATIAFAALALSHLAYAYMLAVTTAVVLLAGVDRGNIVRRVRDLVLVGAGTAAIAAYMIVPFALEPAFLQISPYLPRFRWDSFGAGQVLEWLVRGALLDHGRLAVLTALCAVGAVAAVVARDRLAALSLGIFGTWLVLYFGRASLGPIADLFPFSEGLPAHRFIGAVHVGALMLIALAGDAIWRLATPPLARRLAASRRAWAGLAAAGLILLALAPALAERREYYAVNAAWMEETRAAVARDADARRILDELRRLPPGRIWSGFPAAWGGSLDFGVSFRSVRFYHLVAGSGLPLAAPPLFSWSLNSDLTWDLDQTRPADYDLLNIRYVVAPRGLALPEFLRLITEAGSYRLYEAPTTGYTGLVGIAERRSAATQGSLFQQNRAWART